MLTARWLIAAYACSGLAGLVYEIAWTRLLTLHLGHTTAAVSTVTAAFMGGLGLGAFVGGRFAPRLSRQRALFAYALLEFVVALTAVSLAGSLTFLTPLLAWAYGEDGGSLLFPIVRIASAFALLLVPGMALGATFPMAVRVAVASRSGLGGPAGRLYGANTAGAAIGSLAAGFLLIPIFGLTGTTLTGVAATAGSIALALWMARGGVADAVPAHMAETSCVEADGRQKADRLPAARVAANAVRLAGQSKQDSRTRPRRSRSRAGAPSTPHVTDRPTGRQSGDIEDQRTLTGSDSHRQGYSLAAVILALTGFATFLYEVVWTRVLAMIVGPSIYAIAATLTSFITGLAVGALVGAYLAEHRRRPFLTLALTLIATAAAACLSISLVGSSWLEIGPGSQRAATLTAILLPHLALAFGVTLPISLGLGVAFPLSLELAGEPRTIPARQLGGLYGVNTAASVVGALAAGFITIPTIGLRLSLLLATASLLLGATVLIARSGSSAVGRVGMLALLTAVIAWTAMNPRWDREWLAAGGYLYSRFVPAGLDRRDALTAGSLVYYREGATGTVSVKALTGTRSLSIDGKVDASTGSDMLTQKMLAHLPLLLHPNPRQVAIVGLGSGVTLASALVHPIISADVIEISPEVVEASAHFADVNRRALEDARTRLVRGDGRTHLSLTSRRYDVVVSEPSNPWMAGVATLFTREFFETVREHLAPGGLFCQWAHTYDVSDADLKSIVATFRAVFPEGSMWQAGESDLLLVGTAAAIEPRLENVSTAWQRPGVQQDLASVGMQEPFALLSLFSGGRDDMARYAASATVQTDDRTALEFSGPLAAFGGISTNHAAAIRALLDDGRRPPAVERALADATAAQWRDRAVMLMKAEAFDEAYSDYAKALVLEPSDKPTLEGLVHASVAAHHEDDAERRLRAMIRPRETDSLLRVSLAQLLGIRGRFDEAIAVAADATRLAPSDAAAWEQLASLHADRGDAGALRKDVEVLREQFPNRATTWYFAASEGFLRDDAAAALPLARRALELDPSYADAYNLLGALEASRGDVNASRSAFRKSLDLDPRDAVTYINLAQLELSAGEREAAADLFSEALSLDPSSGPAREGRVQAKRAN